MRKIIEQEVVVKMQQKLEPFPHSQRSSKTNTQAKSAKERENLFDSNYTKRLPMTVIAALMPSKGKPHSDSNNISIMLVQSK